MPVDFGFGLVPVGCTEVLPLVWFFWAGFYVLLSAYFFALAMSDSSFLVGSFLVSFFSSGILSYPKTLKIN